MAPSLRRMLVTAFLLASPGLILATAPVAHAEQAKAHATRGEIKAISADRRVVHIAHEEIPGFMMAMTMTFEPREPEQLAGLAVGDRVDFAFSVTPEGRRILASIRKRASR